MEAKDKSLSEQLEQYFAELERLYRRLKELMDRRQIALANPRALELAELNQEQSLVVEELSQLIARRENLLAQGRDQGTAASDLHELAALTGKESETPVKIAKKLRFDARTLARDNHALWVACQKSVFHFNHLVELIAHGGKKPLQTGTGKQTSQGGVILDASV